MRETPDRSLPARAGLAALGGGLVAIGLRRRSPVGVGIALAGGWLAYRGVAALRGQRGPRESSTGRSRGELDSSAASLTVERSLTIERSPEDLYEMWTDPDRVAQVFDPIATVTDSPYGDGRWRWSVNGPFDKTLSWETERTEERPGERLRWESREGERIRADGWIRFRPAPADRGTETTLRMSVAPPGGPLGAAVARRLDLLPDALVGTALRQFKSLAETGEIPTLEANPSARGRGDFV